jgi:hypothetical protein
MNAKLTVENPQEIEMTLTVTLKLRDWLVLKAQLADSWPSWHLSQQIADMSRLAQTTFYPKTEPAKELTK